MMPLSWPLLSAYFLVGMLAIAFGKCPTQCRCTSLEVICSCKSGDSFILSEIPANHFTLSISNCKKVRIHGTPFNRGSFDRFVIQDSSDVYIADISFFGVILIRRLKFSNIANLTLGSLYNLKTDIFEMDNVTIAVLDRGVIPGIAELKEVRITDSHIGVIRTGALHFQHESLVDIIDTSMDHMEKNSTCIDQVQTFTIRNCHISSLDEDAINLMHVGKVVLSGTSIERLNEGSFLADSVGEMIIVRNVFSRVGSNAFYHMQNVVKLTMSENWFLHVEPNGILLYLEVVEPAFVIENNQFSCDCNLLWLYQDSGYHKLDKFFNSTCLAPETLAGNGVSQEFTWQSPAEQV
ncbi:leucine-rich repeats and immunoglobulin-like domains protein 3 isoform X2 [Varroa jacobsoni]|uniref:Right handed beta helix domain-containing protein n=1 Tax=Varroa destructor TaxID=109461 RepID=A0A7M7JEK3_VARDE|nr:uncharacterized protein LOC111246010 isoform X3 [Varroa destructor]XP_022702861.1 leucine-rich repeats and immunoglobulin-like domains protein 3 isoform X2 [Varroa jacobsoni]